MSKTKRSTRMSGSLCILNDQEVQRAVGANSPLTAGALPIRLGAACAWSARTQFDHSLSEAIGVMPSREGAFNRVEQSPRERVMSSLDSQRNDFVI